MEIRGIVITGTSASGKTSIQRILCDDYFDYYKVKSVTTRKQRADDRMDDYNFVSNEKFLQLERENNLLVKTEYRGEKYGITKKDTNIVLDAGKIPILVITPKSVIQISKNGDINWKGLLTFFIDASDLILNERLEKRDGSTENFLIQKQRIWDRKYVKSCSYYLINNCSEESAHVIHEIWQRQLYTK